MAFTTPCCKNVFERILRSLCVMALVMCAGFSLAGSIEPQQAALATAEDGSTVLSAEFSIDLGPRLDEAVSRGVPLYFTLEFELTRPRWWWSNENTVTRNIQYRLAYTALTRQYRLTTGTLHRNFGSLDEALRAMSRLATLHVADKGVLKLGDSYEAGLRLALDRHQLPKPLQVDAIANRDWQLDTRVLRWRYVPGPYTGSTANNAATTEARP
jgi:hypothetical protein